MEETELVMRLATAAENARDREDIDLAELLDEAEGELELALDLIDTMNTPEARRYMNRHCVTIEGDKSYRRDDVLQWAAKRIQHAAWQQRLTMLLDAARFVAGREVVPVDETLIAMAWNAPHPDMEEPDRVMRAGGYARIGNEYRRQHNAKLTGSQRDDQ